MIKKLYNWLHRKISDPQQRDEYSGGYWQERVRKEALALCRDVVSGRLIEVGCGEGLFISQMLTQNQDLEVWGVDNNVKRLHDTVARFQTHNFKNVHLCLQEATELSFTDEYFDAVVCINVLYNMDSLATIKKALYQMARICKKSGKIIFDFRNALNPLSVVKYKLARYYDDTVKNINFKCLKPRQIYSILDELNLKVLNKKFINPPVFKNLAPIIVVEAQKQ